MLYFICELWYLAGLIIVVLISWNDEWTLEIGLETAKINLEPEKLLKCLFLTIFIALCGLGGPLWLISSFCRNKIKKKIKKEGRLE